MPQCAKSFTLLRL